MAISSYTPSADRIIHNTEVDFQTRTQLGTTVHLMQYDKSLPVVAVALYSNGQPYQIPTGAEMNVRVGKTDGTKVYNPVLGCNSNRTICYFEVTQQMSSAYGPTLAILELILDGAIAGSSYIPLDIARNPAQDEAILSSDEYKSMNEIVDAAREALGKPPKIQNGTWWLWDSEKKAYADTGSPAKGKQGEKGDTGATGAQGQQGETGNGIANTVLNDDYTLTITFTDGTEYKTPSIRGATGAQGQKGETGAHGQQGETGNGIANTVLNDDYTLTITFTDGTEYKTPSIRGETGSQGQKGETGNGIASTVLNEDYTLTITFTDGTSYTTPTPIRGEIGLTGPEGPRGLTGETGATGAQGQQGEKGDTGNGIANTVLNDDYTLTITFTDGTEYKTPSIRGETGSQGQKGEKGDTGAQGQQGEKGDTGNGIASTVLNEDYTLTITFTDGTEYKTPSIRGETGSQGQKGEKGETGSGFKVLGYYTTESALSAAVTNPAAGDAYGIGTAEPYDIYIWDGVNRKWVNNGALQGAKGDQGIQGEQGIQGIQGPAGKDGKTPVVGVDYFTVSDKEEMVNSVYALITNGDTASYGS